MATRQPYTFPYHQFQENGWDVMIAQNINPDDYTACVSHKRLIQRFADDGPKGVVQSDRLEETGMRENMSDLILQSGEYRLGLERKDGKWDLLEVSTLVKKTWHQVTQERNMIIRKLHEAVGKKYIDSRIKTFNQRAAKSSGAHAAQAADHARNVAAWHRRMDKAFA